MALPDLPVEKCAIAAGPGRPLTRRQKLALREYRYGHVTQALLGFEWGIGRSAVSMRLVRARRRLGMEARPRRQRARKRVRVHPASLAAFGNGL